MVCGFSVGATIGTPGLITCGIAGAPLPGISGRESGKITPTGTEGRGTKPGRTICEYGPGYR